MTENEQKRGKFVERKIRLYVDTRGMTDLEILARIDSCLAGQLGIGRDERAGQETPAEKRAKQNQTRVVPTKPIDADS